MTSLIKCEAQFVSCKRYEVINGIPNSCSGPAELKHTHTYTRNKSTLLRIQIISAPNFR